MDDFVIRYTEDAEQDLRDLIKQKDKKSILNAVVKSLKLMSVNLRHPSLNTHKYNALQGPNGEDVFESYAQNNTPGAYRIFWHYGPGKGVITILQIVAHP